MLTPVELRNPHGTFVVDLPSPGDAFGRSAAKVPGDPLRKSIRVSIRDRDCFDATFNGGFFEHNSRSQASRDSQGLVYLNCQLTPETANDSRSQTSNIHTSYSLRVLGSWKSMNGALDLWSRRSCSWRHGLADRVLGSNNCLFLVWCPGGLRNIPLWRYGLASCVGYFQERSSLRYVLLLRALSRAIFEEPVYDQGLLQQTSCDQVSVVEGWVWSRLRHHLL